MTDRTGGDEGKPRFSEIAPARCVELLHTHTIGRVAWYAAKAPEILPVTYVWHEGSVIFRASPHGPLSELSQPTDVAFERAATGVPWASGMRNLLIRITPTRVSGRLVAAPARLRP